MSNPQLSPDTRPTARQRRTVAWVVGIGTTGLVFDGYDLVVYGAVLPVLLRDPTQIGPFTPQLAGVVGSLALVGVMLGGLSAGALSDRFGRRAVLLGGYAWVSVGMAITAASTSVTMYGITRFLTGLGIGALVAGTAPLVAEIVPAHRRNFYTGVTFSGIAIGAMLTAVLAIVLLEPLGWRGMFLLGALPAVTLLPLAWFHLPESPAWLVARGRLAEARDVAERTGVPLPAAAAAPSGAAAEATEEAVGSTVPVEATGFRGLFGRALLLATLLLGVITVSAQFSIYSLNTWLPELMQRAGVPPATSLLFLIAHNGGAVLGTVVGARLADRLGSGKVVLAGMLALGAVAAVLLGLSLPVAALLVLVVIIGLGIAGGNLILYTVATSFYRTSVRGAGVAWVTGIGRLGAIAGPLVGGILVGAGSPLSTLFFVIAGLALLSTVLAVLLPRAQHDRVTDGPGTDSPGTGMPGTRSPGGAVTV